MARRRTKLTTLGHILSELGRQYRRADAGEMDWQDCAAASRVLREARHLLEATDIEARLRRLEEAAEATPDEEPWPAATNGASRHVPTLWR